MRFRRSAGDTSRTGVAYVGGTPQSLRRGRIIRLWITVVIVAAIVLGLDYLSTSWINADGIVVGDLGSIAPVAQGRVTKLTKQCLDYVSRGELIASIEDESLAATATQEIRQFEIDSAQARSDEEIAKTDAQAARSYAQSLESLTQQLSEVFKAETALLQRKYVSSLDWQQAKAALDQAVANQKAAEYLVQSKEGDGRKAKIDGDMIDARVQAFMKTPALSGRYNIYAPKAGYLVECTASLGAVVNVGTSLYSIYNPNDAYVVGFFDPSDATRLHVGDTVTLAASGIDEKLTGKIGGFYPEQSALPDSLTRYFWQDQKWSQYVPVRVDFTGLSEAQQKAIYASSEAKVSLWRPPTTGFFGILTRGLSGRGS